MKTIRGLQKQVSQLPRVKLANLPTPLEEMPRLSQALKGPRLLVKRDDYTGLAFGGNKARKLEFVMADAMGKGADVVITAGELQSNHACATAVAARKVGMKVVLVLLGEEPKEYDGNLLLDHIFGAELRFFRAEWKEVDTILKEVAGELKEEGRTPYVIPSGASYPIGAVGYVNAMLEIVNQASDMGVKLDYIIHAAGSGGTQAGLVVGNKALDTKINIVGMSSGPRKDWLAPETAEIANGTAKLLDVDVSLELDDVTIVDEHLGKGREVLLRETADAIRSVAKTEGILLAPPYTSVAMACLIDRIKRKQFDKTETVLFIHTGGTPTVFAYKKELKLQV